MQKQEEQSAPKQDAESQIKAEPQKNAEQEEKHKLFHRHKRSLGLRLFDVALYPLITNVGVFVISVMATYLTSRGGDKDASGKLIHGKTGEFFQKRGEWMMSKFKNMGMSEKGADMGKMVFFSFADGSLMAPLVKLLEDRRERIGRWIDERCNTVPDDPDIYKKEPKQSWLSVLGGRAATALVVVNTAVALNKTGLNDKMFIEPGIKIGEAAKNKPGVKKFFGKYDVGELAKISIFEAFYTSVCTAGLYFTSRLFARGLNKHKEHKEQQKEAAAHAHAHPPTDTSSAAAQEQPAAQGWTSRVAPQTQGHAAHIEKSKEAANNAAFAVRA